MDKKVFVIVVSALIIVGLILAFYQPAREGFLKATGWAIGATDDTVPSGGGGTSGKPIVAPSGKITLRLPGESGTFSIYVPSIVQDEVKKGDITYKQKAKSVSVDEETGDVTETGEYYRYVNAQEENGWYYFDFDEDNIADFRAKIGISTSGLSYQLEDGELSDAPMPGSLEEASEEAKKMAEQAEAKNADQALTVDSGGKASSSTETETPSQTKETSSGVAEAVKKVGNAIKNFFLKLFGRK